MQPWAPQTEAARAQLAGAREEPNSCALNEQVGAARSSTEVTDLIGEAAPAPTRAAMTERADGEFTGGGGTATDEAVPPRDEQAMSSEDEDDDMMDGDGALGGPISSVGRQANLTEVVTCEPMSPRDERSTSSDDEDRLQEEAGAVNFEGVPMAPTNLYRAMTLERPDGPVLSLAGGGHGEVEPEPELKEYEEGEEVVVVVVQEEEDTAALLMQMLTPAQLVLLAEAVDLGRRLITEKAGDPVLLQWARWGPRYERLQRWPHCALCYTLQVCSSPEGDLAALTWKVLGKRLVARAAPYRARMLHAVWAV